MPEQRLFVVVEYNQASHQPERVAGDNVLTSLDEAGDALEYEREHADLIGRRETYEIFELVPVQEGV